MHLQRLPILLSFFVSFCMLHNISFHSPLPFLFSISISVYVPYRTYAFLYVSIYLSIQQNQPPTPGTQGERQNNHITKKREWSKFPSTTSYYSPTNPTLQVYYIHFIHSFIHCSCSYLTHSTHLRSWFQPSNPRHVRKAVTEMIDDGNNEKMTERWEKGEKERGREVEGRRV